MLKKLTLTIEEAAVVLGISRNLAYTMARAGQLPGVIHLGQKRMVVSKLAINKLLGESRVDDNRATVPG